YLLAYRLSSDRRWANGKLFSSRVAPSLNLRPGVFQNIQPAFDSVSHVDQPIRIDVQIVEHRRLLAFRRRRNEEAHLLRTELVSDVKDSQPGVVIGDEDDIFALE